MAAPFDDDTAPHPATRFVEPSEAAARGGRSRRSIAVGLIVAAVVTVAGAALVLLLVLPPLLSPAPGGTPGYDFAAPASTSGVAQPSGDLLLETADGIIAAFVPAGALAQETVLVLQPRLPAMTPELLGEGIERRHPVDLYGTLPNGEPLLIVPLSKPLLLCFLVDESTWLLHAEGTLGLVVQRFDDILNPQVWIDLPLLPGWTERQVCAQTDHLSLFALGVRQQTVPVPHILVQPPEGTTTPPDLYGIPTPGP